MYILLNIYEQYIEYIQQLKKNKMKKFCFYNKMSKQHQGDFNFYFFDHIQLFFLCMNTMTSSDHKQV